MKEKSICIPLAQFFESASKKFFKYDIENNLIYVDKSYKDDTQSHEILFSELQNITDKLHEINCDYSVKDCGTIILNCKDKDLNCSI